MSGRAGNNGSRSAYDCAPSLGVFQSASGSNDDFGAVGFLAEHRHLGAFSRLQSYDQ